MASVARRIRRAVAVLEYRADERVRGVVGRARRRRAAWAALREDQEQLVEDGRRSRGA